MKDGTVGGRHYFGARVNSPFTETRSEYSGSVRRLIHCLVPPQREIDALGT